MERKWKTKEVVVVALVAAVIGVLYTLMDYLYMPLSSVLGTVFMELTFGIYLLSALLPMYIARKPGFALFGALVTAGVNLLLGSPYGIQLVLAGALQALGIELGFLIGKKYSGSYVNLVLGGIFAAIFVFIRDYFVFGYSELGSGIIIGVLAVRFVSAIVIGILLVKGITVALKKTGALKGFSCCEE
ncbi:MAG: ECF transporter S component [Oscillospiraceae bacterium]|nr:ECF transporter S component [Oscillospiraceae bacterium]